MPRAPAQQLLDKTLSNGWVVTAEITPAHKLGCTGGNFSSGYVVERRGHRAFLKALDFSSALRSPDPARMLESMTAAFNFERDVMLRCNASHMSRVVRALDDGAISIDQTRADGIVQYLIFELADSDVRRKLEFDKTLAVSWKLRTLHHIAVGLSQLHSQDIAHQDVKPSNVLLFGDDGSKLADLGRAAFKGHSPPHDKYSVQGDPAYAPPELLYGYTPEDWNLRRFGCDAYLLGSMLAFLFSGASITSLLVATLDASQRPGKWTDSFQNVLPFIRDAFDKAVSSVTEDLPEDYRSELEIALRQLCDPDPLLRGHPRTRAQVGNPLGLQRFVSLFDLLARKSEVRLIRN